jgi:nucleoside triphosphate diphosphatase
VNDAANRDYTLEDLLYLMARLRDPVDGCPWDRQQDFSSIAPYTIEESYELADAIANGNPSHIREELGDVLFQVIFHAQLGSEQGQFNFDTIVSGLVNKLVKRHPHVFPDAVLTARTGQSNSDGAAVKEQWEAIKAKERNSRKQHSAMDDVPVNLPALSRAAKLQKRAARDGFDWQDSSGVVKKLQEELAELQQACDSEQQSDIAEELGDVLFSCVNLARHLAVDPESALASANRKFERRYRFIEQRLLEKGLSADSQDLDQLDLLWEQAKESGL